MKMKDKMIVILVAPKFQDDEVISPKNHLTQMGADVKLIGIQRGTCYGKGQTMVEVDGVIGDIDSSQFDGLVIPGGAAPETLRLNKEVLELVRKFMYEAKPVAAICHGPQVLISAGVVRGRTLTAFLGIRDDLVNAGAKFLDQEVVVDNNLVTSRTPQDLPAFNKAFTDLLTKYDLETTPWANATPSQILEYAIFNEIKAQTLYENLAKNAKDKLAKVKYRYLAEMERSHRDALTEIFEKTNMGKKPNPRDLGIGPAKGTSEMDPESEIPQNDTASMPFLGYTPLREDILKVLRGAIAEEEVAYHLYSDIANRVSRPEARSAFLQLAEEELSHKSLLESEYGMRVCRELPSAIEKEPWWSEDLW